MAGLEEILSDPGSTAFNDRDFEMTKQLTQYLIQKAEYRRSSASSDENYP